LLTHVLFIKNSLIFFLLNSYRDIDSDGEEMAQIFDEEKPPRLTLWYSVDIKVLPQAPQSVIELESHAMVNSIDSQIPLNEF